MQLDLDIHTTVRSSKRSFTLRVQCASDSRRIVIYGPSGAGKSLTLKAIAGLLTPERGHIRLQGRTLFDRAAGIDLAPQARNVAYLFQDYALFPHLTVRQNVGFGLARGWLNPRRSAREASVEHWLEVFDLRELAQQLPQDLSGGQRQRTALARALVAQPSALLLDEPFAALDPALRVAMRAELDQLQRRLAVPMILITHDMDDAAALGEHVLYLRDGRLDRQEQGGLPA
ncbi:molybdate transport system ATP-binding protein [Oxalobacteraceae bacterium GrIS 1.11]